MKYLKNTEQCYKTGKMVAFKRDIKNGEYECKTVLCPLNEVANVEKKIPSEWINDEGNFVTDDYINYALPLIQGEPAICYENSLPRYARLKKVLASNM